MHKLYSNKICITFFHLLRVYSDWTRQGQIDNVTLCTHPVHVLQNGEFWLQGSDQHQWLG